MRVKLTVAYDGTEYHGWQLQKNAISIEEELNRALTDLLREEIEVEGASRTDAGVHALGNVAIFDSDTRIPAEKIAIALNQRLPEAIRVQRSEEVPETFHPRFCDCEKTYCYSISNTAIQMPISRNYAYHVYHKLDLEKMREAAEELVGTHDFTAFCSAGSQVKDKIRTVTGIRIEEEPFSYGNEGRMIRIYVSGTGFLYNMVRIIAGTLLEIGMGRREKAAVTRALETGERKEAGPTAPAQGLMLMEIQYK